VQQVSSVPINASPYPAVVSVLLSALGSNNKERASAHVNSRRGSY
jgi:hypothetical protein